MNAEIKERRRFTERIEDLEFENEKLRKALRGQFETSLKTLANIDSKKLEEARLLWQVTMPIDWGLTLQERKFLALLLVAGSAPHTALSVYTSEKHVPNSNLIKVVRSKIRKKLSAGSELKKLSAGSELMRTINKDLCVVWGIGYVLHNNEKHLKRIRAGEV